MGRYKGHNRVRIFKPNYSLTNRLTNCIAKIAEEEP